MAKALLFSIALALVLISCNSPTSPDSIADNIIVSDTPPATLTDWKPCVVVQTHGSRTSPEFVIQMDAVRRLHNAGRMDWIRLGSANLQGLGRDYAIEAKNMGLKVFGIIDLKDLENSASWERGFDQMYSLYPEFDIWEVGGEISNPVINNPTFTPEYYMAKFKQLYNHVKTRYPEAVLTSAPTFGSASTPKNQQGPVELERFIQLGLLNMDVIVAVNVYTKSALQQYSSILDRLAKQLGKKRKRIRVWVTETGIDDPALHNDWVDRFYPQIINTLGPEMICWYAMWGGDGPPDGGLGLLFNVGRPPVIENPLFKKLTGGG